MRLELSIVGWSCDCWCPATHSAAAMKRTKPKPAPTTAAAPESKVASERKTTIVAAGIALPHEPPSLVGQVVPIL
jgi:hypothetical protein